MTGLTVTGVNVVVSEVIVEKEAPAPVKAEEPEETTED